MIQVAMLSYWHVHAPGYAKELIASGRATIAAVWDELPERGREQAAELGCPFYADLDELLARKDIDAVAVDAPTNLHAEVIIKAAKAGKHIFTEKCMALTSAECNAIADAVRQVGVQFVISLPHRGFPHNLFVKQAIDEGWLGEVNYLRVRNAHGGASDGWLPAHFYDQTQCGGGAMIDLGAHPMYLIRWLMGKPATAKSAFTDVTGHGVEDNAVTIFTFANGAIAVSETGFLSPTSPFQMEVCGTKGSINVVDSQVQLRLKQTAPAQGTINVTKLPAALPTPIEQFLDAVEGKGSVQYGLQEGLELTEMMEMAYAEK